MRFTGHTDRQKSQSVTAADERSPRENVVFGIFLFSVPKVTVPLLGEQARARVVKVARSQGACRSSSSAVAATRKQPHASWRLCGRRVTKRQRLARRPSGTSISVEAGRHVGLATGIRPTPKGHGTLSPLDERPARVAWKETETVSHATTKRNGARLKGPPRFRECEKPQPVVLREQIRPSRRYVSPYNRFDARLPPCRH